MTSTSVSVPLRGLWFLSSVCLQGQTIIASKAVSVPLRGLWFLSLVKMDVINHFFRLGFRPLAGIMVLIYLLWKTRKKQSSSVSVPLRGLWFLSKKVYDNEKAKKSFPSPCGDYGSYHQPRKKRLYFCFARFPSPCGDYGSYPIVVSIMGRFRPLAGIMVLISIAGR